ncbi:MAG TPA: dihydrofolate reductase family protein [Paracoccaceae bacterium]|nr:dihydrofolate reductase family protein [Paracoccaceae bacterium]
MRKIVLQMMTTLNGRLDDPMEWVHGVSDDQYREIDQIYAGFDTILVGRTTYEEMAAYWPGALAETAGTETNRRMAHRMHDCRKLVFSRSGQHSLTEWHNSERVVAGSERELAQYLADLKAQAGGLIHLSGGASFARSVLGLDLVDEFQFFVYPVVSPGLSWFSHLPDRRELRLLDTSAYENGVVRLHYMPKALENKARPASFSDLLA